jgi:biotin-(acetyl-CoA carboxylase) ligase
MPPGISAARVEAAPVDAARSLADARGPGTLFWAADAASLAAAIVIDPGEPLRLARRAVCAGMLALADALVVAAPPEKPVRLRWPATLLVDGGVAGGGILAWPETVAEDVPPPWLVFGFTLRLAWPDDFHPGETPGQTALVEEGFEIEPAELLESFARHLLFHAEAFARDGFRPIAAAYGKLLDPPGRVLETGDLFQGKYPLAARLLAPDWQVAA